MTTITMTVDYNGTTYPLHRMAWYRVSADGTTTADPQPSLIGEQP